jgi:hypothetical protein
MKPVLTKQDFVRRYKAGEFGNRPPTFDDLSEWYTSAENSFFNNDALYHIRNRASGGVGFYNVHIDELPNKWYECQATGESFYITRMAPTEHTILQGEVIRNNYGLCLTWTQVRKPMRDALAEASFWSKGLLALEMLRHYMCPRSFEWLEWLLDEYPDHVIEFSTYGVCCGTVPNMNTYFWEVRQY